MHPLVPGEHGRQREPLGAPGALERSLPCVEMHVFQEHEAQREAFVALVALVRPLPGVGGQVPLDVISPGEALVTVRALELPLRLMRLPVLGARQQGVEAFAALAADVALSGDVGLPVLYQVRGSGEPLAADGADLRELALLRVDRLVVDGQCSEVGEGAPTQLAGERNGLAAVFALMFGQIPRVLEGSLALRAVKRSLPGVGELVSLDV